MVVIHLCVILSAFAVSMATAGILKFTSLKTIYTHVIQYKNPPIWAKFDFQVDYDVAN
jgi:hypothetical protein